MVDTDLSRLFYIAKRQSTKRSKLWRPSDADRNNF